MPTLYVDKKAPGRLTTSGWFRDFRKNKYLLLILLPCLLYFIVFKYLPMYGVVIAFKDYRFVDGILGSPWNHFQNFKDLFNGMDFPNALKNTVIFSCYRIIFGFPAPIILALLLNEVRHLRYKKFVQTLSYLPHFVSWVVLTGIFMELLSPTRGVVNQLITALGAEPVFFFGDPKWYRMLIVTTGIWQSIGWGSILYLAALAGIDPALYEAAIVDGAGRWKQLLHITLPSLVPQITVLFIFQVGSIISVDFDQAFNFLNPAVYSVGDVLGTYAYRIGITEMQYGLSTATGLFVNIINFTLLVITNTVVKRYSDYAIW